MKELELTQKILTEYFSTREKNLKLLISENIENCKLRDKQSITRIVYGVVRHELLLGYIIGNFKKNKKKCSNRSMILLMTGIFLLCFSDSVPDYAVVNEIVNLGNPGEKGFINAVLRAISKSKKKISEMIFSIKFPNIRYSGSEYYINEVRNLGENLADNLDYLNSEPVFHIRPNLNLISPKNFLCRLKDLDLDFRELNIPGTYEIKGAGKIIGNLVKSGLFYFQNSGSQLVSLIAADFSEGKVLDCCAAPGTKSFTLSILNRNISIISGDINFRRLKMLKDFRKLMNISSIEEIVSDIRTPSFKPLFNLIIADAPCTSSGTVRKNPDLKIKLSEKTSKNHSKVQSSIYSAAANLLLPGGYLLYSVCSFIEEEGDIAVDEGINIIQKSLGKSFKTVDLSIIAEKFGFRSVKKKYGITLLPDLELNNDLFYISLLKEN